MEQLGHVAAKGRPTASLQGARPDSGPIAAPGACEFARRPLIDAMHLPFNGDRSDDPIGPMVNTLSDCLGSPAAAEAP